MPSATILIIAPSDDVHAEGVRSLLLRKGARVVQIDSKDFPSSVSINMDPRSLYRSYFVDSDGTKVRFSEVTALWMRRLQSYWINDSISGRKEKNFARVNTQHAFEGFISVLPCKKVNDIWLQRKAERKAYQLQMAQSCGLAIPDTLITNDPAYVQRLFEVGNPYIYKSLEKIVGASDGTKPLLEKDRERLYQLHYAPTIFQEHINLGYDLRINYVGGVFFAAKILSKLPEAKYDIRLDVMPKIEPYSLPDEISGKLNKMMVRTGLMFATIDMRVDEVGNHMFLEINPAGQWIYVEMQTQQPITETLADYLLSGS